jgi:hypothetical protein
MKQNEITDLPKLSVFRYENFFNIYNDSESDMRFYNLLRNINIFPSNSAEVEDVYSVKYNDTWISISYKMYGTIDLWWLICSYNQITNPIELPEAGTQLKILKSDYVYLVLSELKKQINL